MKKRSELFVVGDKLCTRKDGESVWIKKFRRFKPDGREVTPLFPYLLGTRLILIGSNRPVADSLVYANGDVKALDVLESPAGNYRYEMVTAPFPVLKAKRPPR